MEERERILGCKERHEPKPWSSDPIFQNTYFCNVRREDDRVTKFIREFYSPHVQDPMFEINIVFSRLINWPETLKNIGYFGADVELEVAEQRLYDLSGKGNKVFGDAYIVSTNGLAMPKAQYVCEYLLPAAYERLGPASGWRRAYGSGTLANAYKGLISVRGLGSFMAGQIIADLKNTKGHPLRDASDYFIWAAPGPGSLRGMSWIFFGDSEHKIRPSDFEFELGRIRRALQQLGGTNIDTIHNQDLQNCLCEFDKYCRILSGTGRSKRSYNGV